MNNISIFNSSAFFFMEQKEGELVFPTICKGLHIVSKGDTTSEKIASWFDSAAQYMRSVEIKGPPVIHSPNDIEFRDIQGRLFHFEVVDPTVMNKIRQIMPWLPPKLGDDEQTIQEELSKLM